MTEPAYQQVDRLSPQTVHVLMSILTALRGQEHLVRRWLRLRDDSDGVEKVLERLALTDLMILQLAQELVALEVDADGKATDAQMIG